MEMENNQAQVSEQNEVKADVTQHQDTRAEKTFSQEDVNNIVEKRLAKERNKLEKQWQEKFNALEESVKLSKMSEDEIKEHEFNKRIQALEERERAIQEKENAYNSLIMYKNIFKDDLYVEIQHNSIPIQESVNRELMDLARKLEIKIVATNVRNAIVAVM